MTAILKTSVVQNASSSTANITLDASGGVSIGDGVIAAPSTMSLQSNGSTTALYIDASQNVGIGTTSPIGSSGYGWLTINGSSAGAATSYSIAGTENFRIQTSSLYTGLNQIAALPLLFYTSNTERMRIDSSGNLLVGKTSTGSNALGIGLATGDGANQWRCSIGNSGSTSSQYGLSIYSTGASAYRMYVDMSGTIFATSTTITAISDQRLKENIQDIDVGLDAIMALKPRKFDWKEGKGKDIKGDRGWIAQEFEQVFPEMIHTWQDSASEGEEPYKAVNADLIPVLVKSIQELKATVDAQAAEITVLKAKVGA